LNIEQIFIALSLREMGTRYTCTTAYTSRFLVLLRRLYKHHVFVAIIAQIKCLYQLLKSTENT